MANCIPKTWKFVILGRVFNAIWQRRYCMQFKKNLLILRNRSRILTIFGECSKNEKTKHYVSVFPDLKINLRTEFIFTLLFIIIKQFFFLFFPCQLNSFLFIFLSRLVYFNHHSIQVLFLCYPFFSYGCRFFKISFNFTFN